MLEWLKGEGAKDSELTKAYERALGSNGFRNRLKAMSMLSPIESTRRKPQPAVVIASADDFPALVEGIYRVRCNLFHGGKRAGDDRARMPSRARLFHDEAPVHLRMVVTLKSVRSRRERTHLVGDRGLVGSDVADEERVAV